MAVRLILPESKSPVALYQKFNVIRSAVESFMIKLQSEWKAYYGALLLQLTTMYASAENLWSAH